MEQDIKKKRTKAIRNIADLLLNLSYVEHNLQDKFINGIGDPKETRNEIDENYNQRNELIEDYVYIVEHPFDEKMINKYF